MPPHVTVVIRRRSPRLSIDAAWMNTEAVDATQNSTGQTEFTPLHKTEIRDFEGVEIRGPWLID